MIPEQKTESKLEKFNLELKVRINDMPKAEAAAKSLSANAESVLGQIDTYFRCNSGRLKLREISENGQTTSAELIFYHRPDISGERWSKYFLVSVPNPVEMKQLLTESNGLRGIVEKSRTLYIWNNSRIHLDRVKNLGDFLEFEVISDGDKESDQSRMAKLIETFELDPAEAIAGSYSDLLGL
jgi:predicted adenylyl cyclase CyaB